MGNFLVDFIVAVSIACAAFYLLTLLRKRYDERSLTNLGAKLSEYNVSVRYEESENLMRIYFYTNGILLEKTGGNKLAVPSQKIVSVKETKTDESFLYNVEFTPNKDTKDSLAVISENSLMDEFANFLPEDKLGNDK